jgi:methyl-accepting chemotaxis protein
MEVSPEKAQEHGDTPASRANRTTLGKDLEASGHRNMEAIQQANDDLETFNSRMTTLMLVVALGGLVIGIAVSMLVARAGIARPVAAITSTMTRLAAGDNAVDIPGMERRDEIGGMAKAVEVFKQNAIDRERMAAAEAAER